MDKIIDKNSKAGINDKELLDLIKSEFYRIKPKGCIEFFKKRDKRIPCYPKLQNRFNGLTYNQILIKAGVESEKLNCIRMSKEKLINKLAQIAEELGHIPNTNEMKDYKILPEVLKKKFGSAENALKKLDKNYSLRKLAEVKESNEELLQKYIEFSLKLGHPASTDELDRSNEIYNASVFVIRFGGMMELKKAAGFDFVEPNNRKWNKGEIERLLLKIRHEKGERLVIRDMAGVINTATVLKFYKTTKISEVFDEIESRFKM
ncbi:MAG: hypothetical protein SPE00_05855 [Bacilli bacterium]|nr:hypothetical protein [Bacilli bacterium]